MFKNERRKIISKQMETKVSRNSCKYIWQNKIEGKNHKKRQGRLLCNCQGINSMRRRNNLKNIQISCWST